jgi:uracil-DNA glycosylase
MPRPKFEKPVAGCAGCALEQQGAGFVPGSGPTSARLCFIGESAGSDEAFLGAPFVGPAGGVLSRILHRAGIARDAVRIDNVCRCQPPGNWFEPKAPWYYPALAQCVGSYLAPETLHALPDNAVIVPLGTTALRTILNLHGVEGVGIQEFHGTISRSLDNRHWVVPTFHPSHLQRGAMPLLDAVTEDVKRAAQIADHGFTRSPSTLVVDPSPDYLELFVGDHLTHVDADPDSTWLALDTEFEEKLKLGADESEISGVSASPLLRVNLATGPVEALTFPYREPYVRILERLLAGLAKRRGICWLWHKPADWVKLQAAGHTLNGIEAYDALSLWHYMQSDLPRGLGFVAPLYSDFGPWKHWAKDAAREGEYAAADALQTFRVAAGLVKAAIASRTWDVFVRDWHERDAFVLQPSQDVGVPMDRTALEEFRNDLERKQVGLLAAIEACGAEGTLYPKQGYKKPPKGKDGQPPQPPKAVLGTGKGQRNRAKEEYVAAHVELVERDGRWWWRKPFNPASWRQVLTYVGRAGHTPGVSAKTRQPTTDAASLAKLAAETGDVLYQRLLDYRAVDKVLGTYALGALNRLDADDRLHPEVTCKPSTLRDSSINPNLQNVIADRGGPAGLAAGFRRCVVARDGLPPGVGEAELCAWEQRWQ